VKESRDERRRRWQASQLSGMSDAEVREVGRELFWRPEHFGPAVRQVVNDELRRRGMQPVPASSGEELDYG